MSYKNNNDILYILMLVLLCWLIASNLFTFFYQNYAPQKKNTRDVKTILLWTTFFGVKDFNFGFGNEPFIRHQCHVTECYVTDDRNLMPVDQFDAIVLHGPNIYIRNKVVLPDSRSKHQLYAFFSQEPPANSPVTRDLSRQFNITMTYRLDSDIRVPYFHIATVDNIIVSPSHDPRWILPRVDLNDLDEFIQIYLKKKKPAAWFCSHCITENKRETFVRDMQEHIKVDIYGACGPLTCPRSNEKTCFEKLSKDYFFYLSLENSNCEDYITEKVLTALEHNTIPIIMSGANLSKYLPPMSYINAEDFTPPELARYMKDLMNNPVKYTEYFWWKSFYKIGYSVSPFCVLCEYLHDANFKPKNYINLQEWWYGRDNSVCTGKQK